MRGLWGFIASRSAKFGDRIRRNFTAVLMAAFSALLGAGAVVFAAQTNFLGVVFIADPTTTSRQMAVNADGSINVNSSGGGSTTANQGTAAAITAGWPVTDGAGPDTSGTFTGAGSATINAPIDGYGSLKALIRGTYAGFTINTKASSDGGVTFAPHQCAFSDGSQIGTTFVLTANQTAELACGHQSGDDTFQLQTSAGPATGTANVDISTSAFPSDDGNTILSYTKSGNYVSAGSGQFALAIGTNTQLTVPAGASCAQITVETANIRRTSDATSATTTNGTLIQSGASWQDCGPLAAYKFTAVSGSPTLDVEYFK